MEITFVFNLFINFLLFIKCNNIDKKEIWLNKNTYVKNVPITNLKIIGKNYKIYRKSGWSNFSINEYDENITENIIAFFIENSLNYSFHIIELDEWVYPEKTNNSEILNLYCYGEAIDMININDTDFYIAITCKENQVLNQSIGCVGKNECKGYINDKETLCLESCLLIDEWLIHDNTENKSCFRNCKDVELYIFNESSKECIDECPKYLSPQDSICVDSCINENNKYYRNYIINGIQKYEGCFKNCISEGYYIKEPYSHECVIECDKFINRQNTTCLDNCNEINEYYLRIKNITINCTKDCLEEIKDENFCNNSCNDLNDPDEYYNISLRFDRMCLDNCPKYGLYILNKKFIQCVNKCPKYLSPQTSTCVDSCKNEPYKYYRNYNDVFSDSEIYEGCFVNCREKDYFIKNPGSYECVDKCDNFINSGNDTCLISCNEIGEYFDKIINRPQMCIHDCFTSNLYNISYKETKSCTKRCPYHYFIERSSCKRDENFFTKENKNDSINSNFYIDPIIGEKIYLKNNESCIDEFPFENKSSYECIQNCSFYEISNESEICQITNNQKIIKETYDNIINNFIQINNTNLNIEKYNKIIKGRNITFNLFSTKSGVSLIELLDCEEKLKKEYSISSDKSLYILKINVTTSTSTSFQLPLYEIYNPYTGEQLDLSVCHGMRARIQIWIDIDEEELNNYQKMEDKGFDIYNTEDAFYNDYCTVFSTDSNTELTLNDRKKTFQKNSSSLCPETCEYNKFYSDIKIMSCDCLIGGITYNEKEKSKNVGILKYFFTVTLANLNLKIVKCYSTFFSQKGLKSNISFYTNSIILLINTSIIIYLIKVNQSEFVEIIKNLKKSKFSGDEKQKKLEPPRRVIKKNKEESQKNDIDKSTHAGKNNDLKYNELKLEKIYVKQIKFNKENKNSFDASSLRNFGMKEPKKSEFKSEENNKKEDLDKKEITKRITYLDEELNIMDYKNATNFDKRSFCQIYKYYVFSKHPIISTFFNNNDYNRFSIKFSLFLLSISIIVCVNSLFFTDNTIHQISQDDGKFNFVYQLPETCLTTLISAAFIFFFRKIALSQSDFLEIRKAKFKDEFNEKVVFFLKKIKIKFIAYSIISEIFLIFIWYYLGCFCSVYRNGQYHLYKSFLISYSVTNIYPFILNLFSSWLRNLSIGDDKNNRKFLYKISQMIGWI